MQGIVNIYSIHAQWSKVHAKTIMPDSKLYKHKMVSKDNCTVSKYTIRIKVALKVRGYIFASLQKTRNKIVELN
jgi:hypothetical protein